MAANVIIKNRFPNIDFMSDAGLAKTGKGTHDIKIRNDEEVLCLKWVDNTVITSASTVQGGTLF